MRPQPLLTGRELIAAGYTPGPQFKPMLQAVEDAQLEGSITTPEEAMALGPHALWEPGAELTHRLQVRLQRVSVKKWIATWPIHASLLPMSGLFLLVFRSLERPVVEQRPAHDVFARNESPETRIQAGVAMVAHHEVLARRHHEVPVFDVTGQFDHPGIDGAMRVKGGHDGGESSRNVCSWRHHGRIQTLFRHGLRHAVDEDDALVQMDMVAGNADKALDQDEICGLPSASGSGSGAGRIKTTMSPRRGSR